jgi:hypothetical protein
LQELKNWNERTYSGASEKKRRSSKGKSNQLLQSKPNAIIQINNCLSK